MKHELFDIWEEPTIAPPQRVPWTPPESMAWRVQLVNYVGAFPTRHYAEQFVESTKKARVLAEKSGVAEVPKKKSK
jgi:hypothetical protein